MRCARCVRGWQGKRDDLRTRRRAEKTAAAGRDDVVLPGVFAQKSHWHGVGARVELRFPQWLAGPGFKRPEAAVDRGADEDQSAGGRDAAADVWRAGIRKTLVLQRLHDTDRH